METLQQMRNRITNALQACDPREVDKRAKDFNRSRLEFERCMAMEQVFYDTGEVPKGKDPAMAKKKTTKKTMSKGGGGRTSKYSFADASEYCAALSTCEDPMEKRKIRAAGRRAGFTGGLGGKVGEASGVKKTKKKTNRKAAQLAE